jgi:hypothetical protein
MDRNTRLSEAARVVAAAVYGYLQGAASIGAVEAAAAQAHSITERPPAFVNEAFGIAAEVGFGSLSEEQARAELQVALRHAGMMPVLSRDVPRSVTAHSATRTITPPPLDLALRDWSAPGAGVVHRVASRSSWVSV